MNGEELVESIVLCGGAAKRMKPYLPFSKAFAEVLPGVTLLEYQVKWLFNSGINRVILAIDRETYTSLRAKEVSLLDRVTCSIEEERLGTGGAIKLAIEHVDSSSVYVMNVDDVILSKTYAPSLLLETFQKNQDAQGSILLTRAQFPFGIVEVSSDRVQGFKQKPWLDYKICSGHYAFTKEGVRKYFPQKGNFEDTALQRMAHDNVLYSTELDGDWLTINNIKQLDAARQKLIKH
jgi:D-glycero-alpha-D-manno-heptose 1-phosphate guanylyltransferase